MVDQPLIDISTENWRIVRDILQRYVPDREVWAVGSRATGTAQAISDPDIAIIRANPVIIAIIADVKETSTERSVCFKLISNGRAL